MGWYWQDRCEGVSITEEVTRLYSAGVVADVAVVALSEAYVLVRTDKGAAIDVLLIRFARDGTWGYKPMSETMGPCAARCPRRILDAAAPVAVLYGDDQAARWAAEFRERCHRHHDDRGRLKNLPGGAVVRFHSPYAGCETWMVVERRDREILWAQARRTTEGWEPHGRPTRLRGWRNHVAEIAAV